VGAMLTRDRIASAFTPGSHASTFGGNPLAMAAALASGETILSDGILENCKKMGAYFLKRLEELRSRHSVIREVRGKGLIIGLELATGGDEIVRKCMDKGVLINCIGGSILRFVPPLIITESDVDRAIDVLDGVMEGG